MDGIHLSIYSLKSEPLLWIIEPRAGRTKLEERSSLAGTYLVRYGAAREIFEIIDWSQGEGIGDPLLKRRTNRIKYVALPENYDWFHK